MNLRAAVIDIGTHSTLIVIGEKGPHGSFSVLEDLSEITRLGQGVSQGRRLDGEAMERTLQTLGRYLALCKHHGVDKIRCLGTAALRNALNTGRFRSLVQDRFGLDLDVIPANEEARLTFLSVQGDPEPKEGPVVVADVGGGSTELIRGEGTRIDSTSSVDLGAVLLTERFLKTEPVQDQDFRSMTARIRESLSRLEPEVQEETMIGIGGTVTTLAAIEIGLDPYDPTAIEGRVLHRRTIDEQISRFLRLPVAERARIKGLHPARADVILAGAAILAAAMERFGLDRISVSTRGIRFGALFELLGIVETPDLSFGT